MRYSMYNVVIYDGVHAYVSKFILSTDEKKANEDLQNYWSTNCFDGEILKIDRLYFMKFNKILSLKDEGKYKNTFERFEEMYF